MRILSLNANLRGVGTYQRCFYFSRELARLGHDVTMFTVSPDEPYRVRRAYKRGWLDDQPRPTGSGPWVEVVEGPRLGYRWLPGWGSGPLDILARVRELKRRRFDLVYAFEYQPNVSWPVGLTRRSQSYRLISDWCDWYAGHSNRLRGIRLAQHMDGFFEERIRLAADRVSVISSTLAERARAIGVRPEHVFRVRQGADTEYIAEHDPADARRLLGLPDAPLIVYVRDALEQTLLQAFGAVRAEHPDARLVMVGNYPDAVRAAATAIGLGDAVLWPGRVTDADYPKYLAAADLIALPLADDLNNRARFPGKLLDYLAAARAVVTSDVGEVGDLIRDAACGVLAPAEPAPFAAAVSELLAAPRERQRLGQRARQHMVEEWDWRRRGPRLASILASILASKDAP